MLTLLATCVLAAGVTFTIPQEWTITEIVGGGGSGISLIHPIACTDHRGFMASCPEPDRRTRITLRRTLEPGQRAEAPAGCTLEVQRKE